MFCERKENGEGFCIHFEDSIFLSGGIQEGVDKMNLEFEKCIMKFPSQYSWEYKKFKRTDQKSIYYKYKVTGNSTGITNLLQDLKDANLKLQDLKTEQTTLEKIFVSLVKENNEV